MPESKLFALQIWGTYFILLGRMEVINIQAGWASTVHGNRLELL